MDTALGLLAFCLFIVAVIALAAGISWLVVRLTPEAGASKPSRLSPPLRQPAARQRPAASASKAGVYASPWASATAS